MPQQPRPQYLESKTEVLSLWQELIGRRLLPDEFLVLFSDRRILSMVGVRRDYAREGAAHCQRQQGSLDVSGWLQAAREVERRAASVRQSSLSAVLDGRRDMGLHRSHPDGVEVARLGPVQNYADDT